MQKQSLYYYNIILWYNEKNRKEYKMNITFTENLDQTALDNLNKELDLDRYMFTLFEYSKSNALFSYESKTFKIKPQCFVGVLDLAFFVDDQYVFSLVRHIEKDKKIRSVFEPKVDFIFLKKNEHILWIQVSQGKGVFSFNKMDKYGNTTVDNIRHVINEKTAQMALDIARKFDKMEIIYDLLLNKNNPILEKVIQSIDNINYSTYLALIEKNKEELKDFMNMQNTISEMGFNPLKLTKEDKEIINLSYDINPSMFELNIKDKMSFGYKNLKNKVEQHFFPRA